MQDDSCITLIELPQIRDTLDVITSTQTLTDRCFDKVLVYLDFTLPINNDYLLLTLHQIEFMKLVFGNKISDSIGIFALTPAEDQVDADGILQKFKDIDVSLKYSANNFVLYH